VKAVGVIQNIINLKSPSLDFVHVIFTRLSQEKSCKACGKYMANLNGFYFQLHIRVFAARNLVPYPHNLS